MNPFLKQNNNTINNINPNTNPFFQQQQNTQLQHQNQLNQQQQQYNPYYQQSQDQQYVYSNHHQNQYNINPQQNLHSYIPNQQNQPSYIQQQHSHIQIQINQPSSNLNVAPLALDTNNDWIPNPEEKIQLDNWFHELDIDHKGQIEIKNAVPFLKKSQLTSATLLNIWNLVDKSNTTVNREQFYKIIRLISIAKSPIFAGSECTADLYYKTAKASVPIYDTTTLLPSTPISIISSDYSNSPRTEIISPSINSNSMNIPNQNFVSDSLTLQSVVVTTSSIDDEEFSDFAGAESTVLQSSHQSSMMNDMINLTPVKEISNLLPSPSPPPIQTSQNDNIGNFMGTTLNIAGTNLLPSPQNVNNHDNDWKDYEMGDFVGPTDTSLVKEINSNSVMSENQIMNSEIDLLGPPITFETKYGSANPRISALDELIESDLKVGKEEWGDFVDVPSDMTPSIQVEDTFPTNEISFATNFDVVETATISTSNNIDLPININETFPVSSSFNDDEDFGDFADATNSPVKSAIVDEVITTPLKVEENTSDLFLQMTPNTIPVTNSVPALSPIDLLNQSPLTPDRLKKRETLMINPKSEYKAQSIADLERLAVTLSVKCLYNESYACILQANTLRSIEEMNESKKKAVENDDLELALKLKKDIQDKSKYLASASDEHSWITAMASGIKGEKLQSLCELVQAFNPSIALKFRNKYLDNIPKSNAPMEERMQFYASALRSIRIITAIYTSHSDHPKMWKESLEYISSYISSSINIFTKFQSLDIDDRAKVLKHDHVDNYLKGIISMAEVGLWISATCLEAFIDDEYISTTINQISNLFNVIKKTATSSTYGKKMKSIDQILKIGIDFSIRNNTEFCNITLRPIFINSEDIISIHDAEYIEVNGIPYMSYAYNFYQQSFQSKLLKIETKY